MLEHLVRLPSAVREERPSRTGELGLGSCNPVRLPGDRAQPADGHPALRLRDGGGLQSNADWASPRDADLFHDLRQQWWHRIFDWNLVSRLEAHVAARCRTPLLNDEEISCLRGDLASFLKKQGFACSSSIVSGQPIALDLLSGCLQLWSDVDVALPAQLAEGVSCGVRSTIPASGVWRELETPERPPLELLTWSEPWPSGLKQPGLLQDLVQADVDAGFAEWLDGSITDVRRKFGDDCAAGKLGIVEKPGAPPRLIGDSTISNVNCLCRIAEKIVLPGLDSVSAFVSKHHVQDWVAFSLDFNKAHKRVKLHPSEYGLNLFAVQAPDGRCRWVCYKVCHFGGAWSSYWWSRLAGTFVRLGHRLLHFAHYLSIYVDDLLALLPAKSSKVSACLLTCFACSLGFPVSWHKVDLGSALRWIGWHLDFSGAPSAALPCDKLEAMIGALNELCSRPRAVSRAVLQKLIGRLVWFTSGARWLRPWLQVWFCALNKPGLHFFHADATQSEELFQALDNSCKVVRPCRLSDVQRGWCLLDMAGHAVKSRADLLSAPLKNGRVWLKFGEPTPAKIKLNQDELTVVRFFREVLSAQEPVQLVERPGPGLVAAADAFAEGKRWGIGGWFLPANAALHPSNIFHFSFQLEQDALPPWFCQNGAQPQQHIAALEALAQLVLLDAQRQHLGDICQAGWISLRQSCDNAGVVAASHKGLSLKQPLASVLQSLGLYAARHKLQLRISHVAGSRNEWADVLSRTKASDADFRQAAAN